MITTSGDEIAEKVGIWRLHGLDRDAWKRFHRKEALPSSCVYPGFKYNLSDLAASLGLWQLQRLPEMLARREQLAERYDGGVDPWENVSRQHRPATRDEGRHGLHLYSIVVDQDSVTVSRDHLLAALRAENIGAAIHYEPVHQHPHYVELLGASDDDLPQASRLGWSTLSLPLSPAMSDQDADEVLEACGRVLRYYRR